ncbi:MAG: ABC transporter substrate-binding protein [Alphaproteobacteria bacterium]|nr:ABC transporter substrate-binding protein [Alphaproteobacteria bacterium]
MRFLKKSAPVFFVLAIISVASPSAFGITPAAQAQQTPAGKFIQDLGDQAITVMADKSLSSAQRGRKYRHLLQNSFDMKTIGHFVLGRAWNAATPAQRQDFMKLFEQSVLRTYGDRLNFYSGEKFKVTGARRENASDSMVGSAVSHTNGAPPTRIDWRVRDKGGKMAVVDVIVEGVSQSITQRQEYASILERNGGDIHALLDQMRAHLYGSNGHDK